MCKSTASFRLDGEFKGFQSSIFSILIVVPAFLFQPFRFGAFETADDGNSRNPGYRHFRAGPNDQKATLK
jgi:hypothetical protein